MRDNFNVETTRHCDNAFKVSVTLHINYKKKKYFLSGVKMEVWHTTDDSSLTLKLSQIVATILSLVPSSVQWTVYNKLKTHHAKRLLSPSERVNQLPELSWSAWRLYVPSSVLYCTFSEKYIICKWLRKKSHSSYFTTISRC